ncbi:MAG: SDR family NAD(P)-dependent oxidoreductase [Paracoccaceae bacterium]
MPLETDGMDDAASSGETQFSPATAFSLAGRTALVTGGGSGLGKAIAHALSDAGARIVLVGRREDRLAAALGDRAGFALAEDVTDPAAPDRLRSRLSALAALPDILVAAAGANPRLPADTISREDWDATLVLNLTAPFFLAQAFLPHMRAQGRGRVITLASLQSLRAMPNGIAYGAAKGGLAQATRAMAEAWGPAGVTVNALAPGFFPTELTAPVFADAALATRNAAQTCLGRNGRLGDIAGPAVFLASDAAAYVTGQILFVDGGYTAK